MNIRWFCPLNHDFKMHSNQTVQVGNATTKNTPADLETQIEAKHLDEEFTLLRSKRPIQPNCGAPPSSLRRFCAWKTDQL